MAIVTKKSNSLSVWKSANNVASISVKKSKKDNLYAVNKDTEEFIGMLANDFDQTQPIMVHSMVDDETGDTWLFIANGSPAKEEFAL